MAFAIFRMPPWLPLFAHESDGVDPSWQMLLNEAVSSDWVFGRDLFFTYGPFGFIHARMYHPETWAVLVAAWLGISVITADLVWRVSNHGRLSSIGRVLFGLVMLEFMSRDAMAVCFGLHALVFLEAGEVSRKGVKQQNTTESLHTSASSSLCADSIVGAWGVVRKAIPILLLAALPWAKFSYFVTVAFLSCSLVAIGILQKRIPWQGGLLFAACPLAWLMSGATLVECREFVGTGFQLASGYIAAMGLGPESAAGLVVLVSSGVVVLTLPVWLASRLKSGDWRLSILTMLVFHGLLFIAWKSCFVRYHVERIPVFLGTVFPLLVYGWLISRQSERLARATDSAGSVETGGSWKHSQSQWHTVLTTILAVERRCGLPALLTTIVILVSAGTIERVQPCTFAGVIDHATAPLRDQVLAVAESVRNSGWRRSTHEAQMQKIREANPVPDIDGSVDVFPSKLIVGFAHKLDMRPRPILQSYAAFTPELIERDAQHFRSASAPDHVLISVAEIDHRLPTMEDSRTWFELLSSYDLTDSSGDLLKLSRRKQSCLVHGAEPAWQRTASFGEQVNLPAELTELVWCRIHIEPSLAGHAASIAYRLPELRLRVQYDSGTEQEFRLLPEAARAGFLVSPVVKARGDLVRLWKWRDGSVSENVGNNDHVASIACFVAGEDWSRSFFRMTVKFEFFECFRRIELVPESAGSRNLACGLDFSL
tara:strand:+ start:57636 stop:59768 length:2133 start_codon:yes stop_codon:yes gene_type:complete